MMKRFSIFFLIMVIGFSQNISALSSQFTTVIIIAENAPDDLEITLPHEKIFICKARTVAWVKYFELKVPREVESFIINVSYKDKNFNIVVDESFTSGIDNHATLDLKNESISHDRTFPLYILSSFLAVIITLVLDCAILYLSGFRKRRNWLIVITSDIIAYTFIYLWVYACFPLMFIVVFTRFLAGFVSILARIISGSFFAQEFDVAKQKNKKRKFFFIAEVSSFILGIVILNILPI